MKEVINRQYKTTINQKQTFYVTHVCDLERNLYITDNDIDKFMEQFKIGIAVFTDYNNPIKY